MKSALAPAAAKLGVEVSVTGSYPLLLQAQADLLRTLQQSLLITALLMQIVFLLALRSWRVGLAALLPNLLPVALSLIAMSAFGVSLNVGTSMTAAIALGIAVDDTLHFTLEWRKAGLTLAARSTGRAIVLSSAVIAIGFLALTPSDFAPTRDFGMLCAVALVGAVAADLLVLPPLLLWAARGHHPEGQAHYASSA